VTTPGAPTPFKPPRPATFFWSVVYAWNGLIHTVVHQRNMRMHVISAILVGLVGSGIPLGLAEKVTLIFCVLLVLFAEMLNSALEHLVDLAVQQFDEKARLTKDTAAAGVLVLAVGTVVIFAAVLVHNAQVIFDNVAAVQRQVLVGAPLAMVGGALMHEQRRPAWVNVALMVLALGLWGLTVQWSESLVFSAMTFGMLIVCGNAAVVRQRLSKRGQ
jgi:diacylglycerol kinase (ATP)